MKKLRVKFEYMDEKNGPVKIYDKEIEFPEECPISFFAMTQFQTHVAWAEKMVLKKRIEELEKQLKIGFSVE